MHDAQGGGGQQTCHHPLKALDEQRGGVLAVTRDRADALKIINEKQSC